MTTPDPQKQPPSTDIFTSLISGFQSLHPILAYGGLLLIATILLAWLTGALPNILLAVPFAALFAFLLFSFFNTRAELDKYQREKEYELKVRELEVKERAQEREHERASEKDKQRHEINIRKLEQGSSSPSDAQKKTVVDSTPDEWPHSYLAEIQRKCRRVNMAAIDPRAQVRGRAELSLQAIFTSLDVERRMEQDEHHLLHQLEWMREEEREKMRRQPVLEAISQHPKLVLKGAPGAGKSTLLRYMALCLAGEALGDEQINAALLAKQGWQLPPLLPIHVILRDYAARGLPAKQNLWQFITIELQEGELPRCVAPLETYLKTQGGLLLLDGLDEVPEPNERREALQKAIEQFERDFPKVRILVTTRPYAYDKKWRLTEFTDSELLDFSPEQIETYIGRWYTAAATQDPDLPPDRATTYAQQLQREVAQNKNLRDLAKRPLLLALMVSLHRSRDGGALPHRRVDLYDESVNLLLDLWQRPKIIYDARGREIGEERNALTELGIDHASLRAALSELAYEAHHNQPDLVGTADITRAQLITALDKAIPKEKRAEINQSVIANYVRDRAGLLEDRDGDIYGFPHRTFQEYLAAMHLARQLSFPQNLADLARRDPVRWREAVLLAGNNVSNPSFLWSTIEALYLRRAIPLAQPSEPDFWGGFLAGQLWWDSELRHNIEVDEAVVTGLRNWQVAILTHGVLPPRDRAAAGRVLAELGDSRDGVAVEDGLPDLAWGGVVPAGQYMIGDKRDQDNPVREIAITYDYQLAKYPVTYAQFQCFVEAKDFDHIEWWKGMPEKDSYGWVQEISPSQFAYPNHPRQQVSWYQAVAFCRWLSPKLPDYDVRLPHEHEWEVAAKYSHGCTYPWGADEFDPTKANTAEGGLGQTTAVGLYPTGRQPHLDLYDMSGNVWEWCQNKYEDRTQDGVDDSGKFRVWRGGSWLYLQDGARAAYRGNPHPHYRLDNVGFRLVRYVKSSISSSLLAL